MLPLHALQILRLYLWVALIGFVAGFTGFLTLADHPAQTPLRQALAPLWVAVDVAGPPRAV